MRQLNNNQTFMVNSRNNNDKELIQASAPVRLKLAMTAYQSMFYSVWALNPERSDYNMVLDQEMTGKVDIELLNSSLVRFVRDHLLFNSNILSEGGRLFWVQRNQIEPNARLLLHYPDGLPQKHLSELIHTPFDLEKDFLARFYIITNSPAQYRLIYVLPHILIDGLSYNSLLQEGSHYYNDKKYENPVSIDQQFILYSALNLKLDSLLQVNKSQMEVFWQRRLNGISGVDFGFLKSNLPDRPKGVSCIRELRFNFKEHELAKIKRLSRLYRLTPYIYGQFIYGVLLHRMTGQQRFGICFPVAILEGMGLIYGAHVNTLIIDFNIDKHTTLKDLIVSVLVFFDGLKRTKGKYLPIERLLDYVDNRNILDTYFIQANLQTQSVDYQGVHAVNHSEEFFSDISGKLMFEQELLEKQLNYRVRYDGSFIDETLMAQFVGLYQDVFNQVLDDLLHQRDEKLISSYPLLSSIAYTQQVLDWNRTSNTYPEHETIHSLFGRQVERTPDAAALVYGGVSLSYSELNVRANRLAHYLVDVHGTGPDDLVVLCLDRSEHMLVAILGVLKAGGAYVPLDPGYPADRIGYVVEDTGARVILTNEAHADMLRTVRGSAAVVPLDGESFDGLIADYATDNPNGKTGAGNLAYVIYTSGTTGRPKGVMVEHVGIVNSLIAIAKGRKITLGSQVLGTASYVFDSSIAEILSPVTHGGTIHIIANDIRFDLTFLLGYVAKHNITQLFLTTRLAELVLTDDTALDMIRGLDSLTFAGELFNKRIKNPLPGNIINEYGPTEASICTTSICYNEEIDGKNIGRPISNTTVYVLDSSLRPLPIGAVGELYIGGAGVARGYLNQAELTAERFIVNPFQSMEEKTAGVNGRLYRTGDLARYHSDGNLEYLGRNDFQVKIRGYRIELGEIESALLGYEGIRQSVVLALEDAVGSSYLAGYYVSGSEIPEAELSAYLGGLLPEYMVPRGFVHLLSLPLTVNGKLDRQALPVPVNTGADSYSAPQTALELALCQTFGEVLGIPAKQIGINDDFFRLGGNSIQAIRLTSQINMSLGKGLKVASLLQHRTVSGLSVYLEGYLGEELSISVYEVGREEEQLLSFAQERLWFVDTYSGGSSAYNIPMIVKIRPDLCQRSLISALREIVHRHQILRTRILQGGEGIGYQSVINDEFEPLNIGQFHFDSRESLETAILGSAENIFDLASCYPITVGFYACHSECYLSIVVHHIAFDGWSISLFQQEIEHYYNYFNSPGSRPALEPLHIQYKDYALWQRSYLSGEVLEVQLSYWKAHLSGYEMLQIATDNPRANGLSYIGANLVFKMDVVTSEKLRSTARVLGVSLFSVLLSGYYLLLRTYSGQDDIVVGTPVSNRHHMETQSLIGFFVNMLALRTIVDSALTLADFICRVGRMVEDAQAYQDLPFERLVEALGMEKNNSYHPVFQVTFQMSGLESKKELDPSLFVPYDLDVEQGTAKFDLSLSVDDSGEIIIGKINFDTTLFTIGTIEGYAATYKQILKNLTESID
jgi:amino acid adenylation domain-containing protein